MKTFIAALALTTAVACGKKVEAVQVPPQSAETVPQLVAAPPASPVKSVETVQPETVECNPDAGPVKEVLQSRPEQAVCGPTK